MSSFNFFGDKSKVKPRPGKKQPVARPDSPNPSSGQGQHTPTGKHPRGTPSNSPPSPDAKKLNLTTSGAQQPSMASDIAKEVVAALLQSDEFFNKVGEKLQEKVAESESLGRKAFELVDRFKREKNLIIYDLPEKANESAEDCVEAVTGLFTRMGVKDALLDDVFRLGKGVGKKGPRPVLVKLVTMLDKKRIQKARVKLGKGDPSIVEDKSKEERARDRLLLDHFNTMRSSRKGLKKRFQRGNLQVLEGGKVIGVIARSQDGETIFHEGEQRMEI